MSTISCIIVSYNNGSFLKEAILSVVNQTLPVNEIIVADDGSTDGSRDLITSLAHEHSQIKPIFREKNLGVSINRDLAIRAAQSNLITTLDGDDWYSPKKIEQEFIAFNKRENSIAYSDICVTQQKIEQNYCLDLAMFADFNQQQRLSWMINNLVKIPRDMLFLKKLYLEIGGIQHSLKKYEDWEFKIRLAACPNPWIHSGIDGINYRKTNFGLSQDNSLMHIKYQYQALRLNHKLIREYLGEQQFWLSLGKVLLTTGRSLFGIRSNLKKLHH
ncbi:MAG: glycosyltransferase family 2 protein [Coleofasciculus chthonoplastes F3-SA18-01]|uniref:glycosyltransferase family 2 protein n=1 Tax=Coleofasciculus chthonoplastes TaxID=64178 RepID=UPI0033048E27